MKGRTYAYTGTCGQHRKGENFPNTRYSWEENRQSKGKLDWLPSISVIGLLLLSSFLVLPIGLPGADAYRVIYGERAGSWHDNFTAVDGDNIVPDFSGLDENETWGVKWTPGGLTLDNRDWIAGKNSNLTMKTSTANARGSSGPAVIYDPAGMVQNRYQMWATAEDNDGALNIIYATSKNGIEWNTRDGPVDLGSAALDHSQPTVILDDGNTLRMWYARTTAGIPAIYYATANNDGNPSWTVVTTLFPTIGPGFYDDSNRGATSPYVIKVKDIYHMWYEAIGQSGSRIVHATATDPGTWSSPGLALEVEEGDAGSPAAVYTGGKYRLFYTHTTGEGSRIMETENRVPVDFEEGEVAVDMGIDGTFDSSGALEPALVEEMPGSGDIKMWYTGNDGVTNYVLFTTNVIGSFGENVKASHMPPWRNGVQPATKQEEGAMDVDNEGNVHAVYVDYRDFLPPTEQVDTRNTDVYYTRSNNNGLSFEVKLNSEEFDTRVHEIIDIDGDEKDDIQQITPEIAVDKFGNIHAVWMDDRRGWTRNETVGVPVNWQFDIYYSRSTDKGRTFSEDYKVNDANQPLADRWEAYPKVIVDDRNAKDGNDVRVYITWTDVRCDGCREGGGPQENSDVYINTYLFDDWGTPNRACSNQRVNDDNRPDVSASRPDITLDGLGNIFISYSDNRATTKNLWVAKSPAGSDAGCVFNPSVPVNDEISKTSSMTSSIYADIKNRIYVVWTDERTGNPDIYFGKSLDGGSSFKTDFANRRVNTGDFEEFGGFAQSSPDVVVDDIGYIYVIWKDVRDYINYTFSSDGGFSFRPESMRRASSIGSRKVSMPSIDIDSNRKIHALWSDERNLQGGLGAPDYDVYYSGLYAAPFRNRGVAVSKELEIPDSAKYTWDMFVFEQESPSTENYILASVVDTIGDRTIKISKDPTLSELDLSSVNSVDFAKIKVKVEFFGQGITSAVLGEWNITWKERIDSTIEQEDIDLWVTPENITVSNEEPNKGDSIWINVTVHNDGNETAENARIRFFADGNRISDRITTIDGHSKVMLSIKWTPNAHGQRVIGIQADPLYAIYEIREDNNAAERTVNVTNFFYDFQLSIVNDPVHYTLSTEATEFIIGIANTGNIDLSVLLSYGGVPSGWSAFLGNDRMSIPAGESMQVKLTVVPDPSAPNNFEAPIRINGTRVRDSGELDADVRDSVIAKVIVGEFGFKVYSPDPNKRAFPGTEIYFEIYIDNNDFFDDTIKVIVAGTDWEYGIGSYGVQNVTVTLARSETSNPIGIKVRIPRYEWAGNTSVLRVRAESLGGHVSTEVILTTRVRQYFDTVMAYSVLVPKIDPGRSADYLINITNRGNGVDVVDLSVAQFPQGWSAELSNTTVAMKINESVEIILTLETPYKTRKGTYNTLINATSQYAEQWRHILKTVFIPENVWNYAQNPIEAQARFQTSINRIFGVNLTGLDYTLTLPKRTLEYDVAIANLGNDDDTFDIEVAGIPEEWEATMTFESNIGTRVLFANGTNKEALPIEPFSIAMTTLSFYIPLDAEAMIYPIEVTAISRGSGISNTTSGILDVEEIPEFRFTQPTFGKDPTEDDIVEVLSNLNNTSRISAKHLTVRLLVDGKEVDSTVFDIVPDNKSVIIKLHYWNAEAGVHDVMLTVETNFTGLFLRQSINATLDVSTDPGGTGFRQQQEESVQFTYLVVVVALAAVLSALTGRGYVKRRRRIRDSVKIVGKKE